LRLWNIEDFFVHRLVGGEELGADLLALQAVQLDFGPDADAVSQVNGLRGGDSDDGGVPGTDLAPDGDGAERGALGPELAGGVLRGDLGVVTAVAEEEHAPQSLGRDLGDRLFQGGAEVGILAEAGGVGRWRERSSLEPGLAVEVGHFVTESDESDGVTSFEGIDDRPTRSVFLEEGAACDFGARLGDGLVDELALLVGEIAVKDLVELADEEGELAQHEGDLIFGGLELADDGGVVLGLSLAAGFFKRSGKLFLERALQILNLAEQVGVAVGRSRRFCEELEGFGELGPDRLDGGGEPGGVALNELLEEIRVGSRGSGEGLPQTGEFGLPRAV